MIEKRIDMSQQVDPRGLRAGEFGDTSTTLLSTESVGRISYIDQLRAECERQGLSEERIVEEIRSFVENFRG